MSYGKEIFRPKYKETMDSLNTIKDNYYALDQEYQWTSKEKDEEIERLNNDLGDMTKLFAKEREETNRLNNIIKEVREYITSYINQFNGVYPPVDMRYLDLHKLLDILKGENNE